MTALGQGDRRKYARIHADRMVSVTAFGANPQLAQGRDVSLGGIRFDVVGTKFMDGELLRVNFNISDQTVEAVGRVVWTRELDPITCQVGLEFVRIDPWAARLLEDEQDEPEPD